MSSFVGSSIGKKFFMSLTGLFLISFIFVHLSLNLLLLAGDGGELFNLAANFMATNPMIKIMEPVLGIGCIAHILMSFKITLDNMKARPQKYEAGDKLMNPAAASKNMMILGALVLVFLAVHIANFWVKMKITHEIGSTIVDGVHMHDAYALVSTTLQSNLLGALYILGGILLGMHLSHGFWSAFQTVGFSNDIWRKRLSCVANIIAVIIAVGFSIIPLYFMFIFKG